MSVEQNDQNDDVCFRVTKQNKVLRLRKRAVYNREAIHQVLNAGTLAHVNIIILLYLIKIINVLLILILIFFVF